ncbi:hypothetical protein [Segatella paludivivens]|uniref:hypothetical protein n=1 Tax=Segatella paludivivens TaxID=185294 RepID=UPI000379F4B3|nr:hypothetical protein [Segatella paludivivens]
MKITDCFWEKKNLDCSTVEVVLDKGENITLDDINYLETNFEYIVVKVPVNQPETNILLSNKNFTFIECQFRLLKKIKSFDSNDYLIELLKSDLDFRIVDSQDDFNKLIASVTVNMFSTDRICIDPVFGPEIGTKRYINWMKDEFKNNTSIFIVASKQNNDIGFAMAKDDENNLDGLLGGIFHDFQEQGLGLLTPSFLFLAQDVLKKKYKNVVTSISSNNAPVVQLYNYLNYKIIKTTYVFVKHIN